MSSQGRVERGSGKPEAELNQIKPSSSQHRGPTAKGTFFHTQPQQSQLNTTGKCSLNRLSTESTKGAFHH